MASLHELFHWSIQHQAAANDATGPSEPKVRRELSQTDRDFINAAIRTDASKMKGLIDIYLSPTSTLEAKEIALEDLEYYVQSIDNAADLSHNTVGGLEPMLEGIQYSDRPVFCLPVIRTNCAWVLATALQNNPRLQEAMIISGGVETVIETFVQESELLVDQVQGLGGVDERQLAERGDLNLISKLVYIVSAMLEHKTVVKAFRESGGFKSLDRLLNIDTSRLENLQRTRNDLNKKSWAAEESVEEDRRTIGRIEALETVELQQQQSPALMDIEDEVAIRARRLQKNRAATRLAPQTTHYNETRESDLSLWLRLARRTVHVLYKSMYSHPELRLVYAKDNESSTVKTFCHLLEQYSRDADLRDKTVKALDALTEDANTTRLIIGVLKSQGTVERMVRVLGAIRDEFKEDEDARSGADNILRRLS